jgi:hypothetical protein
LHPGPFIDFADEQSRDSSAIKEMLKINKPDFRMRDVEIFIRYFAFRYFIHEYAGSMKNFLDITCQRFNENWPGIQADLRQASKELEQAHQVAKTIFGKNAYHKWSGDKYEGRFNRAVFDFIAFYFVNPEVARKALDHKVELELAFKELCQNDQDFLSAIERTTKSVGATCTRFSKWAEILNRILGTKLAVFTVQENRIV